MRLSGCRCGHHASILTGGFSQVKLCMRREKSMEGHIEKEVIHKPQRVLRRNQACRYLDLSLLASRFLLGKPSGCSRVVPWLRVEGGPGHCDTKCITVQVLCRKCCWVCPSSPRTLTCALSHFSIAYNSYCNADAMLCNSHDA